MRIVEIVQTIPREVLATLRETPDGVSIETKSRVLQRELQRIPDRLHPGTYVTPEDGPRYLDVVLIRYCGSYLCAEER